MRELNRVEVAKVSGGGYGGLALYTSSGGLGGVFGLYTSPFVAPNAAYQILMVSPINFCGGALAAMFITAVVTTVFY